MAARAAKIQRTEKVSARRAGTWRKRNAVKRRESRAVRLGWAS